MNVSNTHPSVAAADAASLGSSSTASFTLHGAGVSGGIAIGYAHLVSTARLEVAHYDIGSEGIELELERFDDAVNQVRNELDSLPAGIAVGAPAELGADGHGEAHRDEDPRARDGAPEVEAGPGHALR